MKQRRFLKAHFQQGRSSQAGQVIPYVAFLVVVLAGAALLVYDIGYMINSRIQTQNAVDAAALAAVSVKINKHHMDTLVRAAMTQESIIAQAEIRASQAIAFQAFVAGQGYVYVPPPPGEPDPGSPTLDKVKSYKDAYLKHANSAYKHAVKLHRERLALQAWYKWLERQGPTAVREAARLGYALNIQGYDELNDPILRENIENVLADNTDLVESSNSGNTNIGGFVYANEAASLQGMFGKTFAEIDTHASHSAGGAALLKYLQRFELTSNAAAQLLKRPDRNGIGLTSYVTMNWYSPHLMAIEGDTPADVGH